MLLHQLPGAVYAKLPIFACQVYELLECEEPGTCFYQIGSRHLKIEQK